MDVMDRFRWHIKLRSKIFLIVCGLILFVAFFALLPMYLFSMQNAVRELKTARINAVNALADRIERSVTDATVLSELYHNNNDLIQLLLEPVEQGETAAFWQQTRESAEVRRVFQNNNWAYSLSGFQLESHLFSRNGKFFTSASIENPKIRLLAEELLAQADAHLRWELRLDIAEDGPVLLASRGILNPYQVGGEPIGVLLLEIPERSFYRQMEPQQKDGSRIFLLDQEGLILSGNEQTLIGQVWPLVSDDSKIHPLKDGERLVTSTSLPNGWRIVEEVPIRNITRPIDRTAQYALAVMGVSVLLAFLCSWLAGRGMSRPIEELCEKMRAATEGDLTVQVRVRGKDEIGQLRESFNQMIIHIRSLLLEVKEREEKKRDSALHFLLAQINPHFLYNTLNTIRLMISIGRVPEAEEMMFSFMKLLRKTLSDGRELIPLSEELENVENYVAIEKKRYFEHLSVVYEIDERALNLLMPKLLLQPLLENAIFHGGEPKGAPYTVTLRIQLEAGHLRFEISDDGVGMTPERLKMLRCSLREPPVRDGKHIGLNNVEERLTLLYGASNGLSIQSGAGCGTTIRFVIPCVEDER